MNFLKIYIAGCIICLFMACSSDTDSDTPDVSETTDTEDVTDTTDTNDTTDTTPTVIEEVKKIISIESSFDNGTSFWKTNYDDKNRPTGYFNPENTLVNKYIYENEDNFTPSKKEFYTGGNLISTATYEYDSSKRLIKFITGTTASNRSFEYSANSIIIRFDLLPSSYTKIILDDQNRPIKMEDHDTTGDTDVITDTFDFTYENDNLIQLNKQDISFGINSYIINYTFDAKKNPFYNQFKENNLNYILESSFDLEKRVLMVFSKNNFNTESLDQNSRTFEYNSDDYPVTITNSYEEDNNLVDLEKITYQD
ncbi:hypothetical protein ABW636_04550 [Aquimarina sp. 2201CG1-2-11]|uniref:hypothetical protein n=1 Tax=Aquimarina discodermiae TaxID=3231043 RepID=UPI00346213D2